jgi:hypothetical protein
MAGLEGYNRLKTFMILLGIQNISHNPMGGTIKSKYPLDMWCLRFFNPERLYETPKFVVTFVGRDSLSTKLTIRLAIKI